MKITIRRVPIVNTQCPERQQLRRHALASEKEMRLVPVMGDKFDDDTFWTISTHSKKRDAGGIRLEGLDISELDDVPAVINL